MLAVIQAGEAVLVFVALAYWLVFCSIDTLWWSTVIEEIEATGKVFADLSKDQETEPGQEKEQSSHCDLQHLPLRHPEKQQESTDYL